ncbi:MAG: hypothetical protein U0165_10730 [Polyangiaceae bacterium]
MTPSLNAVYEELIRLAASSTLSASAIELRKQFTKRTGAIPDEHPSASARVAASWEDALVAGGLASKLLDAFDDTAERAMAQVISRAQRGVFELDVSTDPVMVRDLWSGGEFLLLKRDDVARSAPSFADAESSVFVGRLVGSDEGCAVLPGMIWLPSESLPLLMELRAAALSKGLSLDGFADALLKMDAQVQTLARVKVRYAFRVEAL